jgi:hypothetical protein
VTFASSSQLRNSASSAGLNATKTSTTSTAIQSHGARRRAGSADGASVFKAGRGYLDR